MEINSLEDLGMLIRKGVTNWKEYGDVTFDVYDYLIIFNYTPAAVYKNRWNWFERNSRGLIMNQITGAVVARPFEKFFNWGERVEPLGVGFEAIEKLDGSMGILYPYKDEYRIATRGSFTSDQAFWATKFLHTYYPGFSPVPGYTFIFEIIYPENRIVVDYDDTQALALIGIRVNHSTYEVPEETLNRIAKNEGFMRPHVYNFRTKDDLFTAHKLLGNNQEGFVIRYNDGTRLKLKGELYKQLHRFKFQISKHTVLKAMQNNTYIDLIKDMPIECVEQIRKWYYEIWQEVTETERSVKRDFNALMINDMMTDRKLFAQTITKIYNKKVQGYMFALYDGKDIRELILKREFDEISTG